MITPSGSKGELPQADHASAFVSQNFGQGCGIVDPVKTFSSLSLITTQHLVALYHTIRKYIAHKNWGHCGPAPLRQQMCLTLLHVLLCAEFGHSRSNHVGAECKNSEECPAPWDGSMVPPYKRALPPTCCRAELKYFCFYFSQKNCGRILVGFSDGYWTE